MSKLHALHDKERGLLLSTTEAEAPALNERGFGIFHCVNTFEGKRRLENLRRINFWFADLDSGSKESQVARFSKQRVRPSMVIETAKGFHVYFRAKDATLDNWERIVKRGIVPALEADPRATDPLRLLRAPGYYHLKHEPFLVKTVARTDAEYTEAQMLDAFPDTLPQPAAPVTREPGSGSFWEKAAALPAREVVARLSGHALCNGEELRLVETSGGKANVEVRKPGARRWEGTPCWVTADDRLAGVAFGATAAAWCRWYGKSWSEIGAGLRELFPEELR